MAASEFPQHERLTRVLNIYRSAMRRRIAAQWRGKYGDDWFEHVFERLPSHQQNEIRATRATLELRRADGEVLISKDEEDEFLIDIPMFLEAVKSRSDLFGEQLINFETTSKIANVYKLRNIWAHPPLRDLRKAEVSGAAEDCASVLELFDPAAAEKVREAMRGEAQQSAPLQELEERLDQLQWAVEGRSLPTEQLQGMLAQLLERSAPALQPTNSPDPAIAAELRALRDELESSRTRLGDWWRQRERDILALLERAAQSGRG